MQVDHYCSVAGRTWRIVAIKDHAVWLEEARSHKILCTDPQHVGPTWDPVFRPGDVVSSVDGVQGVVAILCFEGRRYGVAVGNNLVFCAEADLTSAEEGSDEQHVALPR